MRRVAALSLLLIGTALISNDLYRCPCQETRKTNDKKIIACQNNDGFPCDCGCEKESHRRPIV